MAWAKGAIMTPRRGDTRKCNICQRPYVIGQTGGWYLCEDCGKWGRAKPKPASPEPEGESEKVKVEVRNGI